MVFELIKMRSVSKHITIFASELNLQKRENLEAVDYT